MVNARGESALRVTIGIVAAALTASAATAAAPIINGLSDDSVPQSRAFKILGSGFGSIKSDSEVLINGAPAPTTKWGPSSITAYVPGAAAVGPATVQVVTSGGVSAPAAFAVEPQEPGAGHVAWRFQADSPYIAHRCAVGSDGSVYAQDIHGFVYALSHTGGLKWIFNAGGYPQGGADFAPVAIGAGDVIYVVGNPLGLETKVYALDPDGTVRWVFTDSGSQGIIGGPNVGPDGNIYAVTDLGGLGAFALSPDGALLWSNPGNPVINEYGQLGEELVFGPAQPDGPVDQVYGAFDNYTDPDRLYAFSLGGSQRFSIITGGQYDPLVQDQGQPAVGPNGDVYLAAIGGTVGWRIWAYRPSDGALLWQYGGPGTQSVRSPDVGPDGTIYTVRNLGELHAVNPTGTVKWVYTDPVIHFAPIASPTGNAIVVGGRITYGAPGFVKAFSSNGELLWKVDLPTEAGLSMIPMSRAMFTKDGRRAYLSTHLPGQPSGQEYCYLYAFDIEPPATGDLDGDGDVDQSDLGALLANYGLCAGDPGFDPAADLDGDGCVGQSDLGVLLAAYGG